MDLRDWIGREREVVDEISPRLAAEFISIFGEQEGLLGIHWCLAPDIVPLGETGPDGHARRGAFLPPVPLPRRMWAGGELHFQGDLRAGDRVTRRSRIADVTMKEGRSGALCFVAVAHDYITARGVALSERHDIVYRGLEQGKPAAPTQEAPPAASSHAVAATPLLLFRYSAATFNGHRIHYDRSYCQDAEGYPGLVVHGPLQATCLLRMAAQANGGTAPPVFRYRGVSPLFDGGSFTVNANGRDYWIADQQGHVTMRANA